MIANYLVLLTTIMFVFFVVLGLAFGVPIAYVPENPSAIEFIIYHLAFICIEACISAAIVVYMLSIVKIDFYKGYNLNFK